MTITTIIAKIVVQDIAVVYIITKNIWIITKYKSNNITLMDNFVEIAVVIAVVIITIAIIWFLNKSRNVEQVVNIDQVISAVDRAQKINGNYRFFLTLMGNNEISPYRYAQLVNLYKTGRLSQRNVQNILYG